MSEPTFAGAQAHADAGSTEVAAQQKAATFAGTLRGRVLAAVAARGDEGLTAIEATEALGFGIERRYSVAPRFPELVRLGYATKTAAAREDCAVYVATQAGREWASEVAA